MRWIMKKKQREGAIRLPCIRHRIEFERRHGWLQRKLCDRHQYHSWESRRSWSFGRQSPWVPCLHRCHHREPHCHVFCGYCSRYSNLRIPSPLWTFSAATKRKPPCLNETGMHLITVKLGSRHWNGGLTGGEWWWLWGRQRLIDWCRFSEMWGESERLVRLVCCYNGVGRGCGNYAMLHGCMMAVGYSSCDGMFPLEDSNLGLAVPNRKLELFNRIS